MQVKKIVEQAILDTMTPEQEKAVLDSIAKTVSEAKELRTQKIDHNVDLVLAGLKKVETKMIEQLGVEAKKFQKGLDGAAGKDGKDGKQGPKGDKGADGRDGKDGKNGKDGRDGIDGVSVVDARVDFDGSLTIILSNGKEINAGEVISSEEAKRIHQITSHPAGTGSTSQAVLDALAVIQATIATYGTMAKQNANNVAITGGAIDGTAIGGTTPAAGTFTTLGVTSSINASGASSNIDLNVNSKGTGNIVLNVNTKALTVVGDSANNRVQLRSGGNIGVYSNAGGGIGLYTNDTLQAQIAHTASAVNYVQVTGAATGAPSQPIISAQGSDANINIALQGKGTGAAVLLDSNGGSTLRAIPRATGGDTFLDVRRDIGGVSLLASSSVTNGSVNLISKGTGAIDLAAGSSGVNISNGGTVTAITRTSAGASYTSIPSVAITAPTTAGGVQATASITAMLAGNPTTIQSGGTGYTVNDTLTIVGGTPTGSAATYTVTAVSGGVVTAVTALNFASYSALPTNPVSVTGGTGSGCTLNLTYGVAAGQPTITNAGSGYVEQPTVSFSGGGGSGAAAYATVGGNTAVTGLGSNINFYTAGGYQQFQISNNAGATTGYFSVNGASQSGQLFSVGTGNGVIGTSSTGALRFTTSYTLEQLRVSHTASAVNYVQVTGAATGSGATISSQGSDTNVRLILSSKGTEGVQFTAGSARQFFVSAQTGAVNYIQVVGSQATAAPILSAQGTDTNIDLALTPKGTGVVQFGTYTAGALAIAGYITIKDAGGTLRKLAVVA